VKSGSFKPVLFLIFINDMPLYNPNHNTDLFADDSTISATGKNKLCINKTLNTVLEDISHWCYENRMVLNCIKNKDHVYWFKTETLYLI
jgi:hypothetical protein